MFQGESHTQGELSHCSFVHQDRGSFVSHCLSYAYFRYLSLHCA